MDNRLNALIRNMMDYDAGDAKRIQHFMKVHYFSYFIFMFLICTFLKSYLRARRHKNRNQKQEYISDIIHLFPSLQLKFRL